MFFLDLLSYAGENETMTGKCARALATQQIGHIYLGYSRPEAFFLDEAIASILIMALKVLFQLGAADSSLLLWDFFLDAKQIVPANVTPQRMVLQINNIVIRPYFYAKFPYVF